MLNKYEQHIERMLNQLSEEIKKEITDKGLNNTGNAIESLRTEGNVIYGANYIYHLVNGRGPGKFPPVDAMREWVRTKLQISNDKEVNRIAYLVGRKIANFGTLTYEYPSEGIDLHNLLIKFEKELLESSVEFLKIEALAFIRETHR